MYTNYTSILASLSGIFTFVVDWSNLSLMKKDTLQHILSVGTELIHKYGYNSVGLNTILESSKVPKGSFYYYFKSKEDFGLQVIDYYGRQSAEFLASFLEDEQFSPKTRIHRLFDAANAQYKEQEYSQGCLLGNCSLELGGHSKTFADKVSQHFDIWQEMFAKTIKIGQQTGEINNEAPAEELAQFILNSWEGALVRMKSTKDSKPMDLFIDQINKML